MDAIPDGVRDKQEHGNAHEKHGSKNRSDGTPIKTFILGAITGGVTVQAMRYVQGSVLPPLHTYPRGMK